MVLVIGHVVLFRLSLTKASTYKTQHCCPDVIDNDLRSTADLLLQALSNMRLSSEDSSSPPRPSNFGEACAELNENKYVTTKHQ